MRVSRAPGMSAAFRVFHNLKLIVFAPKDQHRNGNLRQHVRDLGREIGVQRGGVADERELADFGLVRHEQAIHR